MTTSDTQRIRILFDQRVPMRDGMVRARFREGMGRPSLIEPGHIYHYSIDCWNTAQVFKAGPVSAWRSVLAPSRSSTATLIRERLWVNHS